jgi:hypothetical protein
MNSNILMRIINPKTAQEFQDKAAFDIGLLKSGDTFYTINSNNKNRSNLDKFKLAYITLYNRKLKSLKSRITLWILKNGIKSSAYKYKTDIIFILNQVDSFMTNDKDNYFNNFLMGYLAANETKFMFIEKFKSISNMKIYINDLELNGVILRKRKRNLNKLYYSHKKFINLTHINDTEIRSLISDPKLDSISVILSKPSDFITLGYLFKIIPNNVSFILSKNLINIDEDTLILSDILTKIYNNSSNSFYERLDIDPDDIISKKLVEVEVEDTK